MTVTMKKGEKQWMIAHRAGVEYTYKVKHAPTKMWTLTIRSLRNKALIVEHEVFNAPAADIEMYLRQASFDFLKQEQERANAARETRKKYLDEQFKRQIQEREERESIRPPGADDNPDESKGVGYQRTGERSFEANPPAKETSLAGVPDKPKAVARKTKPRSKSRTKRQTSQRTDSSADRTGGAKTPGRS